MECDGIKMAVDHQDSGDGEEELVFYGELGRLVSPPSLTDFQVTILSELGSGETIRSALRRAGNSTGPYSTWAWHVDQAKKSLGARTVAQAVAIAIKRGWLSEPTGADMRVFPLMRGRATSSPSTGEEVKVCFEHERRICSFEIDGRPMVGRWAVIPEGWVRPARYFRVDRDGRVVLPLVVAPGSYTFRRLVSY